MNTPVLATTSLNAKEQARLLGLLDALAGYLGSPGDWGYGTQLGNFTIQVFAIRDAVKSQQVVA